MNPAVALSRDARSAQLGRDVKSSKAALRDLLKQDSNQHNRTTALTEEIQFSRKRLRNSYLSLLFECTFTERAGNAVHDLWTETAHPFVARHRATVAALDAALKSNREQAQRQAESKTKRGKSSGEGQGRKLKGDRDRALTEYRKFLNEEERFWQQIAARVVHNFSVDELRSHLEVVGIVSDPDSSAEISSGAVDADERSLDLSTASNLGLSRIPNASARDNRELRQAARVPANRERLVEVVHRTFISCGDLARYRELSKKSAVTEKKAAGAENGGRSEIPTEPLAARTAAAQLRYDFTKAVTYYEEARRLLPENGNSFNQLGVIAKSVRDTFSSVYHHYRALCVPIPFETAKGNLKVILTEAYQHWAKKGGLDHLLEEERRFGFEHPDARSQNAQGDSDDSEERRQARIPHEDVRVFLTEVVLLHALFFNQDNFSPIPSQVRKVLSCFTSHIRRRSLPADVIVHIVVLAIATSWTTRLWRNEPGSSATRSRAAAESAASVENQILAYILGLFEALTLVGHEELSEALQASGGQHLVDGTAMRASIPATVRRMLPALRIASKWVKSHLNYISRCRTRATAACHKHAKRTSASYESSQGVPPTIQTSSESQEAAARAAADQSLAGVVQRFFASYVDFVNDLRYSFPFDSPSGKGDGDQAVTPTLDLEEDFDMQAFMPIKKAMPLIDTRQRAPSNSSLHPNEEQLQRIRDLVIDAKVIAESESDLDYDDERNVFITVVEPTKQIPAEVQQLPAQQAKVAGSGLAHPGAHANGKTANPSPPPVEASVASEDRSEGHSESTEDVVDLAMRTTLAPDDEDEPHEEEDGEEELILIPSSLRASVPSRTSIAQPESRPSALAVPDAFSPRNATSLPPPLPRDAPSSRPSTAQDLLFQVLNGGSVTPKGGPEQARAPTPTVSPGPTLLFGALGGSSGSPTHGGASPSIWAPEPGERPGSNLSSSARWNGAGPSALGPAQTRAPSHLQYAHPQQLPPPSFPGPSIPLGFNDTLSSTQQSGAHVSQHSQYQPDPSARLEATHLSSQYPDATPPAWPDAHLYRQQQHQAGSLQPQYSPHFGQGPLGSPPEAGRRESGARYNGYA